jgi:hypothetical protein
MDHGQSPLIIGIGGLTSSVGKTTLLCDMLQAFPGWEAIKTTRGHYRSCGKDPHTCCVSDLLETEPVIRSGRELTYSPGKDTGRYWDAGATNVHWVIATDEQVATGVRCALDRVKSNVVLIEGNSFTECVDYDFFVMVARPDDLRIKTTAKRALSRVSAFYFSGELEAANAQRFRAIVGQHDSLNGSKKPPVFTPRSRPQLLSQIHELTANKNKKEVEQPFLESSAS